MEGEHQNENHLDEPLRQQDEAHHQFQIAVKVAVLQGL